MDKTYICRKCKKETNFETYIIDKIPFCFDCYYEGHDEFNDNLYSDNVFKEEWEDNFEEWLIEEFLRN